MITSEIRRILKGTFKCSDSDKLDGVVKEIMNCFMPIPDYDAIQRIEITKFVGYEPIFKYSVVSYCPLDSKRYDFEYNTNDKEEALREYLVYKEKYMTTDDMSIKIIDNETGREYNDGIWYE